MARGAGRQDHQLHIWGAQRAELHNVTAVVISEDFYERTIDPGTPEMLRSEIWLNTFVPGDGIMQVAIHHFILPVSADVLHAAVVARWKAFGPPPPPA